MGEAIYKNLKQQRMNRVIEILQNRIDWKYAFLLVLLGAFAGGVVALITNDVSVFIWMVIVMSIITLFGIVLVIINEF